MWCTNAYRNQKEQEVVINNIKQKLRDIEYTDILIILAGGTVIGTWLYGIYIAIEKVIGSLYT